MKGVNFPYRDYMYGLDKLSVYVEKKPVNMMNQESSTYQTEDSKNLSGPNAANVSNPDSNLNRIINTISVNNRFAKNNINNNLSTKLNEGNMCNFVTRNNYALFTTQIHLECKKPLVGRYIYIQADGRNNRWSRLFSAVFCEIQAYEI